MSSVDLIVSNRQIDEDPGVGRELPTGGSARHFAQLQLRADALGRALNEVLHQYAQGNWRAIGFDAATRPDDFRNSDRPDRSPLASVTKD